jgi:hypothetical protein
MHRGLSSSFWTKVVARCPPQGSVLAMTRLNWTRAASARQVRDRGHEPLDVSDRTLVGGRPVPNLEPLPPAPRSTPQTISPAQAFSPPRRKKKIPPAILRPPRVTILADGSEVVLTRNQRKQRRLEEARLEKERNDERLREALLQLKQQIASSGSASGTITPSTTSPNLETPSEAVRADQEPQNRRKHTGPGSVVRKLKRSTLAPSEIAPERWEEYLRSVSTRGCPALPSWTVDDTYLAVSVSDDDCDNCG